VPFAPSLQHARSSLAPPQWGLEDDSSPVRKDPKLPLEYFFQVITSHPFGPYHCHESLTTSTQLEVRPSARQVMVRPLRTGSLRPSADENLREGGAAGNTKRF
jgi:hypothetical protein